MYASDARRIIGNRSGASIFARISVQCSMKNARFNGVVGAKRELTLNAVAVFGAFLLLKFN
jgi:hypothetical protein